MEINLTCLYCNKKWGLIVWSIETLEIKCPDCNDSNIKVQKKVDVDTDVYGYNFKEFKQKREVKKDD